MVQFPGSTIQPANGTLTLNSSGSYSYVPSHFYVGPDSFTYKASDGIADSNTVTVTINVTDTFVAGEVDASDFSTPYAPQSVDINLLSNYTDDPGGNVVLVSEGTPSQGSITDKRNGVVTYTPDETKPMVGNIQFAYTIFDGMRSAMSICVINLADVKVDLQLRQSGTFSTDNAEASEAVGFSGTSELGPINPSNGPITSILEDQYVCQIEVVGTVPNGAANLTYNWGVTVQSRAWNITNNDGANWTASKILSTNDGFPNPVNDTPHVEFMTTTPSPNTNHIFMSDSSGINLLDDTPVGDYIREEKNFVFTVSVTVNGMPKEVGELDEYQTVIAQRIADTGVISNDWLGIDNYYTQGSTDCTINAADVSSTVGGTNIPIIIDPNANMNS